ncbi:hypothetical protein NCAS_0A13970 [Naumovozyma castellii]|uniref:Nucleolar complex protein 14 n=1 Tax=Naumovozyma castellii TaxID=27288 RepID=G0V906_NAUCA|nr:hypothetical protein NCAS_0A13970 [Naumovozyma castellii CBS 4309]CCC67955.1 hypothetical protein NCAS_0A13970 [Naumovozyma castellii CBS 4309]
MAGSQLKNLKATLKAAGLTGQTNVKKNKKNSKRQPKAYDREEKARVIANIREQFNPFEVKMARNKRREGGPSSVAVGKPGISKQIGEEQRKKAFETRSSIKNRRGGVIDKRFGERDKDMTEEEKMLERFTRERQSQSRNKKNIFNLDDDYENDEESNEDMFGNNLTHLGQSLEGDLGLDAEEGEFLTKSKRPHFDDDATLGEVMEPTRKKTKAEVMKEVIAKSKFYKHERQKAKEQMNDQIDVLDEDFDDVMSELMSTQPKKKMLDPKSEKDIDYDVKVKELLLEPRAAPTDRTKTEEEIENEAKEKRKQLEQQRLDRMQGMVEDEEGQEKGVEDLDNEFWACSEEENESNEDIANSDDDIEFEEKDEEDELTHRDNGWAPRTTAPAIACPLTHNELLPLLEKNSLDEHPKIIRKIIQANQPKLAENNKERLGKFTGVLLRHILFLSNEDYSTNVEDFKTVQNSLVHILKKLSEKYNQALSNECRIIINEIQKRFKIDYFAGLLRSDLVFFTLIGSLFSTSDQYHLVVTPCLILISEFLEQIRFTSLERFAFGAVLAKISLQYQRIAKRYIPELVYFSEKALSTFLSQSNKIVRVRIDSKDLSLPIKLEDIDFHSSKIKLHDIFAQKEDTSIAFQVTILMNILESIDFAISSIWKNLPAFSELTISIQKLLIEYHIRYPKLEKTKQILDKLQRLQKFDEHIPLTLQNHKPVSIPSHAPKFEENFNPDKKSYDPDRTRQEINKMKAQIKKERKFTMKEIRKDTKFEARQRIEEKKKSHAEYHAKMAHIINTISTEEGAEKNKYEREKKLRSGKK